MSDLSELVSAIIARRRNEFDRILAAADFDLNGIDEYGFTPLIEIAIVNDIYFAKCLLHHKVDVNKQDATGRTALHWACDNNNIKLAKLLLDHGTDPNIAMSSGQTALVFPLLRRQEKIKNLLYRYGANLKFAQNFINTKLLGHRFELQGETHMASQKKELRLVDFEGFFLEFSLAVILDSLKRFRSNFAARHLVGFFPKLKVLLRCIRNGEQLIRYQHYLLNVSEHQAHIMSLIQSGPLFLPVTYQGHAISFVKYGDLLMKCDRGANSKREGTVVIYQMRYPEQFNQKFILFLIYQQHTESFVHYELNRLLGLQKIDELPVPAQITGNCAWANIEGSIPGILYLLLLNDRRQYPKQVAKELALDFYHEWQSWDQDRSLDFLISEFETTDKTNRAALASIAGAIFFQACHYESDTNVRRAERLLPIIKETEFRYIYNAYIQTYFSDDPKMEQHLIDLLDVIGH